MLIQLYKIVNRKIKKEFQDYRYYFQATKMPYSILSLNFYDWYE